MGKPSNGPEEKNHLISDATDRALAPFSDVPNTVFDTVHNLLHGRSTSKKDHPKDDKGKKK